MSARRPRVRRWRRLPRALALSGRARVAHLGAVPEAAPVAAPEATPDALPGSPETLQLDPGPHATALREDRGPLAPLRLLRPRQGRLGDCWVMASMLAIHETAPERLGGLITALPSGVVEVRLPAMDAPIVVDRQMPVDEHGRFLYACRETANPGWAGVLEKAIAAHVAGGYDVLQRGFARFGLELLLGMRVRTLLRLPDAATIVSWRAEGRAIAASTHPLSGRVRTLQGPLPTNHVFAVVGADARTGHVELRNPTRPGRLLRVDARSFRRGFLSADVTPPLR